MNRSRAGLFILTGALLLLLGSCREEQRIEVYYDHQAPPQYAPADAADPQGGDDPDYAAGEPHEYTGIVESSIEPPPGRAEQPIEAADEDALGITLIDPAEPTDPNTGLPEADQPWETGEIDRYLIEESQDTADRAVRLIEDRLLDEGLFDLPEEPTAVATEAPATATGSAVTVVSPAIRVTSEVVYTSPVLLRSYVWSPLPPWAPTCRVVSGPIWLSPYVAPYRRLWPPAPLNPYRPSFPLGWTSSGLWTYRTGWVGTWTSYSSRSWWPAYTSGSYFSFGVSFGSGGGGFVNVGWTSLSPVYVPTCTVVHHVHHHWDDYDPWAYSRFVHRLRHIHRVHGHAAWHGSAGGPLALRTPRPAGPTLPAPRVGLLADGVLVRDVPRVTTADLVYRRRAELARHSPAATVDAPRLIGPVAPSRPARAPAAPRTGATAAPTLEQLRAESLERIRSRAELARQIRRTEGQTPAAGAVAATAPRPGVRPFQSASRGLVRPLEEVTPGRRTNRRPGIPGRAPQGPATPPRPGLARTPRPSVRPLESESLVERFHRLRTSAPRPSTRETASAGPGRTATPRPPVRPLESESLVERFHRLRTSGPRPSAWPPAAASRSARSTPSRTAVPSESVQDRVAELRARYEALRRGRSATPSPTPRPAAPPTRTVRPPAAPSRSVPTPPAHSSTSAKSAQDRIAELRARYEALRRSRSATPSPTPRPAAPPSRTVRPPAAPSRSVPVPSARGSTSAKSAQDRIAELRARYEALRRSRSSRPTPTPRPTTPRRSSNAAPRPAPKPAPRPAVRSPAPTPRLAPARTPTSRAPSRPTAPSSRSLRERIEALRARARSAAPQNAPVK